MGIPYGTKREVRTSLDNTNIDILLLAFTPQVANADANGKVW